MTNPPSLNEYPAIHCSQPGKFLGWLHCVFRLLGLISLLGFVSFPARLVAQQPAAKEGSLEPASAVPLTVFELAEIENSRWYSNRDFLGRPLVVVHVASWSPSAHRLLPLWRKQLQQAGSAQRAHIVAIAHDQHATRAAWMCHDAGWTWPVLHDPLLEAVPNNGRIDFPWASVFDAHGSLVQQRLTLAELIAYLAKLEPESASQSTVELDPAERDALPTKSDPAQRLAHFRALRRDAATLDVLKPVADQLLRFAFHAPTEQADEYLQSVMEFYQEALNSTEDGQWAFRMSVAYRLAFDLSHAGTQVDATLWQKSLDYLELANQSATVLPAWSALWSQHHPPGEQPSTSYVWLADRCRQSKPLGIDLVHAQRQLGFPLFEPRSAAASDRTAVPQELSVIWPRATPVPPASIQFQTVWVDCGNFESAVENWSRLYLHVRLKRGHWSLQSVPRLEWRPYGTGKPDETDANQPQVLPPVVQIGLASEESETSEENAEASAVWLQIDVRWPEKSALVNPPDLSQPPRRNAKLTFQGRDPLTGAVGWREAEFYLEQPKSFRLDR
ncbi:MAG: hypothetical protein JNL67_14700 [Planctomycetaceae bacterium]|nr:hypothetical protein [Planctomycetaceae bacterium]